MRGRRSTVLRSLDMSPGTKLGPYEIVAPLGAGGMGEVYRARDTRLGREVAIKVLPASFTENTDRLRRFEQEARTTGMLNHPNILAVYDVGTHEGAPYLVTELLEGKTLREELPIPRRKALDYGKQIATGLAAAHAKGVTHRDLKPENLFVCRDGRVKILDFGLAKVEAPGAEMTRTAGTTPGVALGTVGYMSPEQARGEGADARSDIFAFGVILYEMLSGERAFHRNTSFETLTAILKDDPPPLPDAAMERVVRRCLEKSPEQRFQSASDLGFAIDAMSGMSGSTVAQPAATDVPRPRHAMTAVAVVAAALFAAGVFTAGQWWQARRDTVTTGWKATQLGGAEMATNPRISPDGHTLAFLAMVEELTQVAVMNPESGSWTILTHDRTLGEVDNLCWSRDGSKIYFDRVSSIPKGIYTVSALGGEERLILEDAASPEALPDGSLVVMRINAKRNTQAFRFWPDSGKLEALGDPGLLWIAPFSVAPEGGARLTLDGSKVLFAAIPANASKSPAPHLYSLDFSTKQMRQLAPDWAISPAVTNIALAPDPVTRRIYVGLIVRRSSTIFSLDPDGNGPPRPEMSLTEELNGFDFSSDGTLFTGQANFPTELLRFNATRGAPERLTSWRGALSRGVVPLLGGSVMLPAFVADKERILVFRPGKDPTNFLSTDEETAAPVVRLGEKEVAFLAGSGSERSLAVATLSDGRIVRRFPATKGLVIAALASAADGGELYYVSSGDVWRIPAQGGDPRKLTVGDQIAADPRGKDLIVLRNQQDAVHLIRVSLSDGSEHPIPFNSDLRIVWLSPHSVAGDGRIAITVSSPDRWFYSAAVLDPATGNVEKLPVDYRGDIDHPAWTPDGHLIASGVPERESLWRFRREKP